MPFPAWRCPSPGLFPSSVRVARMAQDRTRSDGTENAKILHRNHRTADRFGDGGLRTVAIPSLRMSVPPSFPRFSEEVCLRFQPWLDPPVIFGIYLSTANERV